MVEEDVQVKRKKSPTNLHVQDVGGRDFLSKPILITDDGNFIISCQDFKVNVFSAQTGLPVKSINTGKILSIALSGNAGEVPTRNIRKIL